MRYDGSHRQARYLEVLAENVDWVSFCPETSAGMGTPRPPMDLHQQAGERQVIAISSAEPTKDIDTPIRQASRRFINAYPQLAGFVHQNRSPSCGRGSARVYQGQTLVSASADGLFAQELKRLQPHLPFIEAETLDQPLGLILFLAEILAGLGAGDRLNDDLHALANSLENDENQNETSPPFERIESILNEHAVSLPNQGKACFLQDLWQSLNTA